VFASLQVFKFLKWGRLDKKKEKKKRKEKKRRTPPPLLVTKSQFLIKKNAFLSFQLISRLMECDFIGPLDP
jgi:hypothetical protein